MKRKNEVTIVFFFVFNKPKNQFYKNTQNQRAKLIFSKNHKILLFNWGIFQHVSLTWNENLCERSKRIEVEDRIQKTDGEDKETVLDFLAQYEVYGYWRSGGGFGRRICKVGKGAQVNNLLFLLVFLRKHRCWAFLYLNNTLQASDSPTFKWFFGLIFPMKWIFEPTVLLLRKASRC